MEKSNYNVQMSHSRNESELKEKVSLADEKRKSVDMELEQKKEELAAAVKSEEESALKLK